MPLSCPKPLGVPPGAPASAITATLPRALPASPLTCCSRPFRNEICFLGRGPTRGLSSPAPCSLLLVARQARNKSPPRTHARTRWCYSRTSEDLSVAVTAALLRALLTGSSTLLFGVAVVLLMSLAVTCTHSYQCDLCPPPLPSPVSFSTVMLI